MSTGAAYDGGSYDGRASGAVPAGAAPVGGVPDVAGHTRISTQALTSTAQAVAAEVLGVPAQQIRARWGDDLGLLALTLLLPIAIPALTRVAREPAVVGRYGGSVLARAHAAKPLILQRVADLTGSRLSRVDIRISGVSITGGGRVL